jgi:hypothetical protein
MLQTRMTWADCSGVAAKGSGMAPQMGAEGEAADAGERRRQADHQEGGRHRRGGAGAMPQPAPATGRHAGEAEQHRRRQRIQRGARHAEREAWAG